MRAQKLRRLSKGLAIAAAAAWSGPASAAVSAGNVTDARVVAETPGDNWLVKGGSFAQQQFSPLKQINDKNVAHLGLAWITEMDDPMGLAAEPIVVDGVIYVSAPRSIVRAIDAGNGKILWTFDPHVRLDLSLGNSSVARVNRGVAVWEGKVYVGTADGRLVAMDAAKGTQLWSSQVVDPTLNGISGAPRVAEGVEANLVVGCDGPDSTVRRVAGLSVQTLGSRRIANCRTSGIRRSHRSACTLAREIAGSACVAAPLARPSHWSWGSAGARPFPRGCFVMRPPIV